MRVRILDLDGGVARQPRLRRLADPVLSLHDWGPRLRLACGWGAFERFKAELAWRLHGTRDRRSAITFIGSGDFHHLTLALLRRQVRRCNLLVLDNHPDWMTRVPLLHCGTWLHHAAELPQVERVFHAGGDVDFDNAYRWLAPWGRLREGKVVVFPAVRRFEGRLWEGVPHEPLRERVDEPVTSGRVEELIDPYRGELSSLPLYVSLDRDVMRAEDAVVNWDNGRLTAREVFAVLEAFLAASDGLAAMDVAGDWSEVRVTGAMRRMLHWTEHPWGAVDAAAAQRVNEGVNLALVECVRALERQRGLVPVVV